MLGGFWGLGEPAATGSVAHSQLRLRGEASVTIGSTQGAKVEIGGRRMPRPGYFYEPTILGDVGDGFRVVDEEQFGPVLPVIPFRSVDDVIDVVNRGPYGLCASVWTADFARGAELAARLDVGTTWVNQHLGLSPLFPFGGFRSSGIGRENGRWGLDNFLELQTIIIPKSMESAGRGIRALMGKR
jgi:acyl-CoA reductase-like NAD-dependent aldehyde dehydrogenase